MAKSEGENTCLILLLILADILADDRQRLVRQLNDEDNFTGAFAICITPQVRPKSMSRKQIKATLSCSSVTVRIEAAGEMERNGAGRFEHLEGDCGSLLRLRHELGELELEKPKKRDSYRP